MKEMEPESTAAHSPVARKRRGIWGTIALFILGGLVVGPGGFLGRATGEQTAGMGCGGSVEEELLLEARGDVFVSKLPADTREQTLRSGEYPSCIRGYSKANYGGEEYRFWCKTGDPKGWNDQLASIRIPKNRKVTVYEHENKTGRSKTLAGDVRDLGQYSKVLSFLSLAHFNPEKCVTGYRHKRFKGDKTYFCPKGTLSTDSSWHNQISSFKVPSRRRVKVCTGGDRPLCRSFFKNVGWVGYPLNDVISWVETASFDPDDFSLVMMSDPQYGYCERVGCKEGPGDSTVANDWHVRSIQALRARDGSRFAGVVVNGDLTNEIDTGQRAEYERDYEQRFRFNVYPGLGNHDYDNWAHKKGCGTLWSSSYACTKKRLDWFAERVDSIPTLRKDIEQTGTGFKGSLAYSFDIGRYHFVQLNNHPSFALRMNEYYYITKSHSWLRQDLKANRHKPTVLNLHVMSTDGYPISDRFSKERKADSAPDACDGYCVINTGPAQTCNYDCVKDFDKFLKIIDQNPQVQAIFTGHLHGLVGSQMGPVTTPGGRVVPVYFGGSAELNHYPYVRFLPHQLSINTIDSTNGEVTEMGYEDQRITLVRCGKHDATSCNECPKDRGRRWCKRDCKWKKGECVPKAPLTPFSPLYKWYWKQGMPKKAGDRAAPVCMRLQLKNHGTWGPLSPATCQVFARGNFQQPGFWPGDELHIADSFEAFRWWRVGDPRLTNKSGPGQDDNRGCIYETLEVDHFENPANLHPQAAAPGEARLSDTCRKRGGIVADIEGAFGL